MEFKLILPQRIIFGEGTIKQVGEQAKRLGGERALIVTSRGMRARECFSQIAGLLKDSGIDYAIYSRVGSDPSLENMIECAKFAEEALFDLTVGLEGGFVIGLGGGSVMDVAKRVATDLRLPKIMVPTTAGSGSEVTHDAVFKVDGKKRGSANEELVADVAIVDPELAYTLSPRQTASSGIDALAHAVESNGAKRGNALTERLASDAYEVIKSNLEKAIGGNYDARVNLSLGSLMAGMAFGNSGTTLSHALAYPLSNRGLSHGEAVAIVLPYAIEFNKRLGLGVLDGVIDGLRDIIDRFKFGAGFEGDIEEMAKEAMEDERHLSNNPEEVKYEDVVRIYKEVSECVMAK